MDMKNTFKASAKQLGKGFFGLFIIQLLLSGGALLVQSCQAEEELVLEDSSKVELDMALLEFNDLVRENIVGIQQAMERNQNLFQGKEIDNSLLAQKVEEKVKLKVAPLVSGTKKLLGVYGITDEDFSESFEDIEDSRIVLLGLAILSVHDEVGKKTAMNFAGMFMTSAYAQDVGDTIACAGAALGFDVFNEIRAAVASGKKIEKKVFKKAIKTVAKRLLGPIGVAMTVAEFAACMWIAS